MVYDGDFSLNQDGAFWNFYQLTLTTKKVKRLYNIRNSTRHQQSKKFYKIRNRTQAYVEKHAAVFNSVGKTWVNVLKSEIRNTMPCFNILEVVENYTSHLYFTPIETCSYTRSLLVGNKLLVIHNEGSGSSSLRWLYNTVKDAQQIPSRDHTVIRGQLSDITGKIQPMSFVCL